MHPSTATTSVKRPLSRNSACEECKLRKIKCPAQKPKCMNCVQHDRLCTYPEPSARRLYLERRYENGQGRSERSVSNETSYQNGGIYPSHGSQISRPAPYPARNPGLHSFQPSAGTGADQPLPAHLDELDFSWLLDIPTLDAPTPEFDQEQYLWLYFTYQTFSGLEMSITRFYERLASPDDAERPHPALLNAIYMTVTRASLIPSVRAKTEMYYDAAQSAFRGAIKDYGTMRSNMLDLMRAAVLMCEWLWTEFREGEALMMTAEACRIATGCCFDQIPSSKSIEPPGRVRLLLRRRPFVNLPRDYVELADRIYAFWSVAMLDMSASIATCMPLHIDILDVVTPLPNPWGTYGEGSSVPDCHVADLFKSPHEQVPPQTHFGYVIQATVLFHLAGRSSVRRFGIKPVGSIESQLRLPMPVSSQQLGLAIEQFDKTLPVAMKSPEVSVDGMRKFAPSTLTIQFFLTAARMYYSDTNTYDGPNDAALYQARHTVDLVRLCAATDIESLSLLVYIMWVLAAEMLLREVKRLEIRGETLGALALNGDIDFLIQALSIVARDSALLAAELEGLEDNKAWQPEPVTSTNTSSGAGASALLTPRSHLSGQSGIAEAQSHSV